MLGPYSEDLLNQKVYADANKWRVITNLANKPLPDPKAVTNKRVLEGSSLFWSDLVSLAKCVVPSIIEDDDIFEFITFGIILKVLIREGNLGIVGS